MKRFAALLLALALLCQYTNALTTQDWCEGYEGELWYLRSAGVSAAWEHTDAEGRHDRLGDGVTVAVVDSGVMANHPDLASAHILDYVALGNQPDGVDDYHGTFVAGLLAAEVNNGIGVDGIVPNVNILPICITWGGGKTSVETAAAGISKAVDLGADVITFSIGGANDDELLYQACKSAADQGVIMVTCAGNYPAGRQKSAESYMYPAGYDCVVTVSACQQDGDGVTFAADYSYFNDAVTVSAPGTNITSLYLDGSTVTRTGTSFAAPIVTAMAAMAKQADRSIDTERFVQLLKESSIDMGEPGYDPYYGFGYVSIPAFLAALDAMAPSAVSEPEAAPEPETAPEPEEYADVAPDAWYYDSVRWAAAHGVMNGTGNGCFSPDASTSRAMVATILWRLSGQPAVEDTMTFQDVPDGTWYTEAIRWAASVGVVTGYSAERFAPEDVITREQLATLLHRFARYAAADSTGMDTAEAGGSVLDGFADGAGVSDWALDAMRWAVDGGMLGSVEGTELLCPGQAASRAQVAAALMQYSATTGL